MFRDPLKTLLRIRRSAVEEGRRTLATSLDAADVAAKAVRKAELAIIQETARATHADGSDALVEAFAAWLPGARHQVAQAISWQDRQDAEVARCRADLTACRQALESLEQLCATRQATQHDAIARQEALRLDEVRSGSKPDPG